MQIFLLKDLPNQGKAGTIINVADGYGRNFVIKNGYGRLADTAAHHHVKSKGESVAFHKQTEIDATRELIKKLENVTVTINVKQGANGKMFGGITGAEIAAELNKRGFEIDKRALEFAPIKSVGAYKIRVKFNHGFVGEFNLNVGAQ
jgi:large subunit ribosomal protein L9